MTPCLDDPCESQAGGAVSPVPLFLSRGGLAREVLEPGDLLRRTVRPSFERFPVLGRDPDDPPLEDVGLSCVERLARDPIILFWRTRVVLPHLREG